MRKTIRIGTRDSELALWQANTVKKQLEDLGYNTRLVAIKSTGDFILDKPLYKIGVTGIFTKTLDTAMINGAIDIAVHSMKDVPTSLAKGIIQAAVLKRDCVEDILVHRGALNFLTAKFTIATGSLRRKAQWLHKYPNHEVLNLRGNITTRLQKLRDYNWNGAIFAKAGLERINAIPENHIVLDWMLPAPAQGAVVVVAMEYDDFSKEALSTLNHKDSEICTQIERDFLKTLEGGCTAPVGALAKIGDNAIVFKGALFSTDGKEKVTIEKSTNAQNFSTFGGSCAKEILDNGGEALMKKMSSEL
jgi:hydroxymethylbilane synthase